MGLGRENLLSQSSWLGRGKDGLVSIVIETGRKRDREKGIHESKRSQQPSRVRGGF